MSDLILEGIVDSTLREGEQRAGVVFDFQHKLKIVERLAALGIEEIEIGVASPRSPELLSLVPDARKIAKDKARVSLWSRCCHEDIFFASLCNPDSLSLSIPVSDVLVREKLGRNRSWVLEKLKCSISTAFALGIERISVGLEDATRADPEFLCCVAELIDGSGALRLRLADTVGIASPDLISKLVKCVRKIVTISVGVHTHNDFGMATANSIAALEAGARWVDATVLGLGERAGNCRLEEIIGYLVLQKDVSHYEIKHLRMLCDTVAEAAQTFIQPHHPVVGEQIFMCETGLHVQGLVMNPEMYEPFAPDRLGHRRTLLFGSKTGRRAVQKLLSSAGVSTSTEQVEELVNEIRHLVKSGTRPLIEKELICLAQQRISSL